MGKEKNLHGSISTQNSEWQVTNVAKSNLVLTENEERAITNLFQGFVENQKNTWNVETTTNNIYNEFLGNISKNHLWLLTRIQNKIGRPLTIDDISFLTLQDKVLHDITEKSALVDSAWHRQFLGIQLAYIEKYKNTLEERAHGFSSKQKNSFKKLITKTLEENMSFERFFEELKHWEESNPWIRDVQMQLLHKSVKYITPNDISDAMRVNWLFTNDEKTLFSKSGKIPHYSFLQKSLNDAGVLYKKYLDTNQTIIDKKLNMTALFYKNPVLEDAIWETLEGVEDIEIAIRTFDPTYESVVDGLSADDHRRHTSIVLADMVSQKNRTLWTVLYNLIKNDYSLHACDANIQQQYMDCVKECWLRSVWAQELKDWFCYKTELVNETQLQSVIDAIFDLWKTTITLPSMEVVCEKNIYESVAEYNSHNPLSSFAIWVPLQIRIDDVQYDLGKDKDLKKILWDIAIVFHETQQNDQAKLEWQQAYDVARDELIGEKAWKKITTVLCDVAQDEKLRNTDSESEIISDLFIIDYEDNRIAPIFQRDIVAKNLAKSNDEKIIEGIRLLNDFEWDNTWFENLSKQQQEAIKKSIIEAHTCTKYAEWYPRPEWCVYSQKDWMWHEVWKIAWSPATAYYYTNEQIKRKAQILKEAWLTRSQVTLLLRAWIAWDSPLENLINDEIEKKTQEKQEIENKIAQAKIDLKNAERALLPWWDSLQKLQTDLLRIDNTIKNKNNIYTDIVKHNAKNQHTYSDADKILHKKYETDLEKEIEILITEKNTLLEKKKDVEKQLWIYQQEIDTAEHELKRVEKDIKDLQKRLENVENMEIFDWDTASDAQVEEFYNRKKEEYTQKKEYEAWQKEQKENLLWQIVNPWDPQKPILIKEIADHKNEIIKWDSELKNLERKYRFYKKDREKKEFDRQDETPQWQLKNIWSELGWYKDINNTTGLPQRWDQIFMKYPAEDGLNFGTLWSLWMRCVIDSIDPITHAVEIKIYGVSGPLTMDGRNIEGEKLKKANGSTSFLPSEFKSFLDHWSWDEKIKMPKYDPWMSMEKWWIQLKAWLASGVYALNDDIKKRVENLVTQVDFSSMKKQNPDTKKAEVIKYMWRAVSNDNGNPDRSQEWYKIEYISWKNMVRVSQPSQPNGQTNTNIRDMSYDSFLLFCADKWLQPFSQEEVDKMNINTEAWKDYIDQGLVPDLQDQKVMNKNKKKWLFWWHWTTIKAMKSWYKKIFDGCKKKVEDWNKADEEKLRGMMTNSSWMKSLAGAWIPVLSEVLDDMSAWASAEADRSKLKKIDEFEQEPEKFKDTTPWGAFDYIEAVLFKNPAAGRNNLLRVAWYFQYCCKKWDLYPRALSGPKEWVWYKDQAMWIKLLLWDKWQKMYLEWYAKQKLLLEKDPENLDLKNRVLYGEAYFLSKVVWDKKFKWADEIVSGGKKRGDVVMEELWGIYSKAWMWGILDKAVDGWMWSQSKISSKKDELNKKEGVNFSGLYTDIFDNFEWKGLTAGMWHLEPMARKMKKNDEYYQKWSMCMLYPILSWQMTSLSEWSIKGEYLWLTKQYAFPLWLYAWGTPNGRQELVKLLTLFEQTIQPAPTVKIATIVNKLGDKTDKKSLWEFTKSLKERWWDGWKIWSQAPFGKQILEYMSSPQKLFTLEQQIKDGNINGNTLGEQESKNYSRVLWSYIDTKFIDKDVADINEGWRLDALSLKKNIWSLSPWFIRNMWLRNGNTTQFSSKVIEHVPWMWDELTKQLKWFAERKDKLTEREVSFLLSKFFMFTNGKITQYETLLYSMYAPHTMEFNATAGGKWQWGQGWGQWGTIKADIMKWAVLKTMDGRSNSWENLPPVIRNNIEVWMEILTSESVKKYLPSIISQKKVPELNDSNKVINKLYSNWVPEEEAKDWFNKKFNNKPRKQLEQNFGDGEYDEYDDEDEYYYNPF